MKMLNNIAICCLGVGVVIVLVYIFMTALMGWFDFIPGYLLEVD